MANQFVNLPVPVGNGVGAAVDVSSFGASKSVVVGGNAQAQITVEINNDAAQLGSWSALKTVQNTGEFVVDVACRWMRVRVAGYNSYAGGAPNVDVGGDDAGTSFAALAATPGNGVGAAVDVSALGIFKTVQVGGDYRGMVIVEVSEDGNDYGQPFAFQSQSPGFKSMAITAEFMRVRRVGVPKVDPGLPIVNVGACEEGGGGGGGGGGGSSCLIYRPGSGESGPTVFDDFADLYAQLETLRAANNDDGCYTIMFDDTDTSPAVVPAAEYDMTHVTWEGSGDYRGTTIVELAEDVEIVGLRKITNYLSLRNAGATTPIADMALVHDDLFTVGVGCDLRSAGGGAPLIDVTSSAFDSGIMMEAETSLFGTPIRYSAGAGNLVIMVAGSGASIPANTLSNTAGGEIVVEIDSSAVSVVSGDQADVVGDFRIVNNTRIRLDPVGPVDEDVEVDYNEVVQCDPSALDPGTPLVITLPEINVEDGNDWSAGKVIYVKNVTSSSNPIDITPSGANTIDGVAGPLRIAAGFASVQLVSDNNANWMVVKAASSSAYSPPEQWAINGTIDAGEVDEPLSAQISTSFDTWQALVAGAVVGLGARFTDAIVAGSAIIAITINGVVTAGLDLTCDSGSNPTGGIAAGAVPYAAGDLIGIVVTTSEDPDFSPTANNLEVQLRIQDA